MTSIESIGLPLAYKVSRESYSSPTFEAVGAELAVRVQARNLEGMQKEALVHHAPSDTTWRMVSDEGPYLNGTDLAPFPLAFYGAGMAFSFLSELQRHASENRIEFNSASIMQDNFYTMEGSAIRGDMIGGALPSQLRVQIESDAAQEDVLEMVRLAEASSPAQSYMNHVLTNTFSLTANGRALPVDRVTASTGQPSLDPAAEFERVRPARPGELGDDIITKRATAEKVAGVEGGAGSSLKSEQKRTLHVHTQASIRSDGLKQAEIRLIKPIGSTFAFLSSEDGSTAPPSLAYLAAGVGFCYMTQLGRYAKIVKQDLAAYRIVQENLFRVEGNLAVAQPVDTQLFVNLNDTEQAAQRLLYMGERTCFLHAAMRSSNRSELRVELRGEQFEVA